MRPRRRPPQRHRAAIRHRPDRGCPGWHECPIGSLFSIHAVMRSPTTAMAEAPMPICAIAPSSMERISLPILVSTS